MWTYAVDLRPLLYVSGRIRPSGRFVTTAQERHAGSSERQYLCKRYFHGYINRIYCGRGKTDNILGHTTESKTQSSMSSTSNGEQAEWLTLDAKSEFESDDEALESLVQLKEITFDDVFSNRETNLESEDEEGISIFFYDDDSNSLTLSINGEGDLIIHLTLTLEKIEIVPQIMNRLLGTLDSITPHHSHIIMKFDIPFNSLDLPIKESDMDITGIKISSDEGSYVIIDDGSGGINVNHQIDGFSSIDSEFPKNFLAESPENVRKLVTEELT